MRTKQICSTCNKPMFNRMNQAKYCKDCANVIAELRMLLIKKNYPFTIEEIKLKNIGGLNGIV